MPTTTHEPKQVSTFTRWTTTIVHNMIIHPMIPAAMLLEDTWLSPISKVVYHLHDTILPNGASQES